MSQLKPTFQYEFPEECPKAQTWLLFFCNPLLKETFVEILESNEKYRKSMQIKHYYYFHPRLQQKKKQKNVVDNKPKEQIKECPVFECKEVAVIDQPQEEQNQEQNIQERKQQKYVTQSYQFHPNIVDMCVAVQFTSARDRHWLENNLGLGMYPMEFVKSALNIDQLNRNNLFEWERTMPYTDNEELEEIQSPKKKQYSHKPQHILFISFNSQAAMQQILINSTFDQQDGEEE